MAIYWLPYSDFGIAHSIKPSIHYTYTTIALIYYDSFFRFYVIYFYSVKKGTRETEPNFVYCTTGPVYDATRVPVRARASDARSGVHMDDLRISFLRYRLKFEFLVNVMYSDHFILYLV